MRKIRAAGGIALRMQRDRHAHIATLFSTGALDAQAVRAHPARVGNLQPFRVWELKHYSATKLTRHGPCTSSVPQARRDTDPSDRFLLASSPHKRTACTHLV
jgi:hypothetical protein